MADVFLYRMSPTHVVVDCDTTMADWLQAYLRRYKLRSKVLQRQTEGRNKERHEEREKGRGGLGLHNIACHNLHPSFRARLTVAFLLSLRSAPI